MDKNRSASSGKAPLLVSIPPTRSDVEKEAQLRQAAMDLLRLLEVSVTGGEIVGVSLDKITPAERGLEATMTISIRIPASVTTLPRPNSVERWD